MSATTGGRRRANVSLAAESEALDRISKETAERLAKRQQARDEARKIRISEIEKQQREAERAEAKGGNALSHSTLAVSHSGLLPSKERSDLEEKVADFEEQHRRDMLLFTQLDNEKSALRYELDLIKDDIEEQRELLAQSRNENRTLTSELQLMKRTIEGLEAEQQALRAQIRHRDKLIHEAGLVLVEREMPDELPATGNAGMPNGTHDTATPTTSSRLLNAALGRKPGETVIEQLLFAQNTVAMIDRAVPGSGTLDEKVRKLVNTNKAIRTQLEEAEQALHQRRTQRLEQERQAMSNGPDYADMQKDALKQAADMKFKLQEAEREKANVEGLNARLESQLKRYKQQAEENEQEIAELKQSNRNLKKELREKECSLDEQQQTNKHLQNRLEKLRLNRQKHEA